MCVLRGDLDRLVVSQILRCSFALIESDVLFDHFFFSYYFFNSELLLQLFIPDKPNTRHSVTARLKSSLVAASMLASQQKLTLASLLITSMVFAEGVKCPSLNTRSLDRYNTLKHTDTLMSELPQRIKVHLSGRVPDIGSV